jgi:hypothetical protein
VAEENRRGLAWWQTKSHHSVYHDSRKEKHLKSFLHCKIQFREIYPAAALSLCSIFAGERLQRWERECNRSEELDIIFILHLHPARELFATPSVAAPQNSAGCVDVHFSRSSTGAKVSYLITSFLQQAETLSSLEYITVHQSASETTLFLQRLCNMSDRARKMRMEKWWDWIAAHTIFKI